MALIKPEYWISVGAVLIIFAIMIGLVGLEVGNTRTLDNASIDYVQKYSSILEGNKIETPEVITPSDEIDEDLTTFAKVKKFLTEDILAVVFFFTDKVRPVFGFINFLYNLPSFFLEGFGIPLAGFRTLINVFGTIFGIAIILMTIRIIR